MIPQTNPHYFLHLDADRNEDSGQWGFSIRGEDGTPRFEANDREPEVRGDRLGLLAVVRGLEALDEPARVTLVGCTRYVQQGMACGLPEWRENGWRWEWFGQMVPVKNGDLWQRLDRALRFHRVDCQRRRFDAAHGPAGPAPAAVEEESSNWGVRITGDGWLKYASLLKPSGLRGGLTAVMGRVRRWLGPWRVRVVSCRRAALAE
jgi:ribonuclease HI